MVARPSRKTASNLASSSGGGGGGGGGGDAVAPSSGTYSSSTDFDLWLKMATDNKINAKNSWNFALIDYFHDLALLRDGDGINFQKASATLDGCVKIYSSRVDSAVTETGILLSGLSNQQQQLQQHQKQQHQTEEDEDAEYDSDDPEYGGNRSKKQRHHLLNSRNTRVESTIVSSFQVIRARKVDCELEVDPIFRRALADFDEGGAKSLLLNMLSVDSKGRVSFDSEISDRKIHYQPDEEEEDGSSTNVPSRSPQKKIDIMALGRRFIPEDLTSLSICPSINEIESFARNYEGKITTNLLDNLVSQEDVREEADEEEHYQGGGGSIFFDDNDNGHDNDDDDNDVFLGDKSINITLQRLFDESGIFESSAHGNRNYIESVTDVLDHDLMAYFDNNMKVNWQKRKSQEHWKVLNLKSRKRYQDKRRGSRRRSNGEESSDKQFRINFLEDDECVDEDEIFSESTTSTFLPKHQWNTRSNLRKPDGGLAAKHVLPVDIQFTSKRLIRLFTKPEITLRTFNKRIRRPGFHGGHENDHVVGNLNRAQIGDQHVQADEAFWSDKYRENERMSEIFREDLHELHQSYDQSFFQDGADDDNGGDDDAIGEVNPMGDNVDNVGGYGTQTAADKIFFKPTYINFSRVAKRVDVRLLKENLWECLQDERDTQGADSLDNVQPMATSEEASTLSTAPALGKQEDMFEKKFSDTIQQLTGMYSKDQLSNLSTSFCFICVLHLANEHGLSISSNEDNTDLSIQHLAADLAANTTTKEDTINLHSSSVSG